MRTKVINILLECGMDMPSERGNTGDGECA